MSHQDRKSQQQIVVNHQVLREVFAWLLPPALFVGMHVRKGSTWKPRMLAAAAILWAASCRATLGERFDHARKITGKIFANNRHREKPTRDSSRYCGADMVSYYRWSAVDCGRG